MPTSDLGEKRIENKQIHVSLASKTIGGFGGSLFNVKERLPVSKVRDNE